jgi:hypothetical protein
MAPKFFNDLGKSVNDLFKQKKYTFGKQVEVKQTSANFETTSKASIGNTSSAELTTKYSDKAFGSVEVKTDSVSAISTKIQATKLAQGLKITVEAARAKNSSASLEAKYTKDSVAAVAKLDQKKNLALDAVVQHKGLSVGAAGKVSVVDQALVDYNAALQYTKQGFVATLSTANKFDQLKAQISNQVDSKTFVAAEFQYNLADETRKLQFGGQYKLDAETTVKAKIAQDGSISGVWQHRLNPAATLSLGVDTDAQLAQTKAGFKLELSY